MAYIDKVFWHDQHDRKIHATKAGITCEPYDELTLRWRWDIEKNKTQYDCYKLISMELYGKDAEDIEFCMTPQEAMKLATKLMQSVIELSVEEQISDIKQDLRAIQFRHNAEDWSKKMIELRKWSYKDHKYHKHYMPATGKYLTYGADMEEIVNCAQCGKELKLGETYTSLEVHTKGGIGYGVCEECYEKEQKRKLENGN